MNIIDHLGAEFLETHERLSHPGGEGLGTHLIILRCTIPPLVGKCYP